MTEEERHILAGVVHRQQLALTKVHELRHHLRSAVSDVEQMRDNMAVMNTIMQHIDASIARLREDIKRQNEWMSGALASVMEGRDTGEDK